MISFATQNESPHEATVSSDMAQNILSLLKSALKFGCLSLAANRPPNSYNT